VTVWLKATRHGVPQWDEIYNKQKNGEREFAINCTPYDAVKLI